MKIIDSFNNPYIKQLKKLSEKKYRDESRLFLIEGEHLVKESLNANTLETVLIVDENDKVSGVENIKVSEGIIKKLAFTRTPQKIIGVSRYLETKNKKPKRILLLDDVQDPGNVGSLIRSSLGFDIDLVVLSKGSVDKYNDKLIRSTQGALFHIDVINDDIKKYIDYCKFNDIKVFGTSLTDGIELSKIAIESNYALILGNEARGVSEEYLKDTNINIYIKMNPKLESLNVAVAGSIIMNYLNK